MINLTRGPQELSKCSLFTCLKAAIKHLWYRLSLVSWKAVSDGRQWSEQSVLWLWMQISSWDHQLLSCLCTAAYAPLSLLFSTPTLFLSISLIFSFRSPRNPTEGEKQRGNWKMWWATGLFPPHPWNWVLRGISSLFLSPCTGEMNGKVHWRLSGYYLDTGKQLRSF